MSENASKTNCENASKTCTPETGARGKRLVLSRREVEQLRDELTEADRHAVVDGLFDWFLGRDFKQNGISGMVLDLLVQKQVAYLESCRAHALAGANGGRVKGTTKARFGNKNASKTATEKTQANASKRKQNRSPLTPSIPVPTLPGNNITGTGNIPARPAPAPTHALARETPSLEQVLAYAKDAAHHPSGTIYPEDWAREFFILNEEAEPKWTKKTGEFIGRNWRQEMIYAWKRHLRYDTQRQTSGQQPAGVKLGVSDKFDFTRFGEN